MFVMAESSLDTSELSQEQMTEIEQFSYLWESDEEWLIWRIHWHSYHVAIQFTQSGKISVEELRLMRALVPELANLPPAEARKQIGTSGIYDFGVQGGREGSILIREAKALGLNVIATWDGGVIELPGRASEYNAISIKDEKVRSYVIQRMREAGRGVGEVDED